MGYRQIAEDINSQIRSGSFAVNDRLPTVAELAKQYDVAALTIRRAIGLLKKNGWVTTTPRKSVTVRAGWGSPPAQYHVGFAYLEMKRLAQPGLTVMPALSRGLRKGFGAATIQISALPFHPETQLQEISRGCLDSGINALVVINSNLLKVETVEFLKLHKVPLALFSPESFPYGISCRADMDAGITTAIEALGLPDAKEVALIHFSRSDQAGLLRQAFSYHGGELACAVPNEYEETRESPPYELIYDFIAKKRPAFLFAGDETLALHARRAMILNNLSTRIITLTCIWPDGVWPGDYYFDTFQFFEAAGKWFGQSFLEFLNGMDTAFGGRVLTLVSPLKHAADPLAQK